MVYANIEYLSKDGSWRALGTWAFVSGELLISATAKLVQSFYGCSVEWRMRIRH